MWRWEEPGVLSAPPRRPADSSRFLTRPRHSMQITALYPPVNDTMTASDGSGGSAGDNSCGELNRRPHLPPPTSAAAALPSRLRERELRRWRSSRAVSQAHRRPSLRSRSLTTPSFGPSASLSSSAQSSTVMRPLKPLGCPPPIPLCNFGNTCYMNATLQCILHSPELLSCLEGVRVTSKGCPATAALLGLENSLGSNVRQLLLTIKKEVAKLSAEFLDNRQSDAHEFLRTFLSVVHNENNIRDGKNTPYEELKDIENESEEETMRRWRKHFLRFDDSVIYDLFGGILYSKCVCSSCGRESRTFDPFLDLSLPIPYDPKRNVTIETLLKKNFDDMGEKLRGGNQLLCAYCRRLRNGMRILKISQWPKLLVLHLKRFDDAGRKNSAPVVCPVLFMPLGESSVQYQLYGVICHYGTENLGHYASYVRLRSGEWYYCNDSGIVPSNVAEAIQKLSQAYILFYAATDVGRHQFTILR